MNLKMPRGSKTNYNLNGRFNSAFVAIENLNKAPPQNLSRTDKLDNNRIRKAFPVSVYLPDNFVVITLK